MRMVFSLGCRVLSRCRVRFDEVDVVESFPAMNRHSINPDLPESDVRAAVRRHLLPWFRKHARDLPWRKRRSAYRVWISEMMLQQTRVETARSYYKRWMKSFPSLKALSEAPRQDVMKAWEGLGYYARARNVHRTARLIVRECGGRFPATVQDLQKLPGIGPYTAAAISSLAFGLDAAVVDGNVARVLSRLYRFKGDPSRADSRRQLQDWAEGHLVPGRAGEVNEAMMELGATICLPQSPRCAECPFHAVCAAAAAGDTGRFPTRPVQPAVPHRHVGAGVIINRAGKVLLARRPDDAMLGGLWEFPGGGQQEEESLPDCVCRELREELGIHVRVGPHFVTVRHAFSHFTMDLHAFWARIERGRPRSIEVSDYRWVEVNEIGSFPLPKADQEILKELKRAQFPDF